MFYKLAYKYKQLLNSISFHFISCFGHNFLRLCPTITKRIVKAVTDKMEKQCLSVNVTQNPLLLNLNRINKLVCLFPEYSFLYVNRAFYQLELGEYTQSISLANQGLYERSLFARSTAYLLLERNNSAYSDLSKLIKLSKNAKYFLRFAHSAFKIGHTKEAEEYLSTAIEMGGTFAKV